jgi:replicative DNA helicase
MSAHDFEEVLSLPPHSVEAEASVLGGLLLDNAAWDRITDLVEADFYRHEHRLIFRAVTDLVGSAKPADVVTVHEHLRGLGKADEVGGVAYLNSLAQYVPSASNARRYAEIIRARATQRRLLQACTEARSIATNCSDDAVAEACSSIQALFEPIAQSHTSHEPQRVCDLVAPMLDRLTDLAEGKTLPGVPTGVCTLDRHLGGGLKPGKQIVIAARPSVGKTSLATDVALRCARAGEPAAILTMEMPAEELGDRLVARLGRIDLGRLGTGTLEGDEWSRLTEAVEALGKLPLFVDDQPALTLHEIRAKARKLKRVHGLRVLVVDYLQLCASSTQRSGSNRHLQLEEISRGTKALAKQLGITVILLSQLNREVEKRTGGRPTLADLKESGAIEEDADVVILLSKDGDRDDGAVVIHAELAKNRGGKRNVFVKLAFNGAHQSWCETSAIAAPSALVAPVRRSRHFTGDIDD